MSTKRMLDVLWSTFDSPKRGPKPQIDRGQIVGAAIRVADEEGIDVASMQRIAAEVGVTKMALYRHVPARPELVALMVEAALGPAPDVDRSWCQGLRSWAEAMRVVFMQHRWVPAALSGPRLMGPAELAWTEVGLAALADIPLTSTERLDTLVLVGSHVRGTVEQSASDASDPEHALGVQLALVLDEHGRGFPLSAAAFAEASAAGSTDQSYEYGLERILAGVEYLISDR